MRKIKYVLNSTLMQLTAWFIAVITINMFTMNTIADKREQAAALNILKQKNNHYENQCTDSAYFIYEADTNSGICFDKTDAKDNSHMIKNMTEDGHGELIKIPLNYSIKTIKRAFNVLNNTIDVNHLSLKQIIKVANLFNFLEVTEHKFNLVLTKINEYIKENGNTLYTTLKELHPDLQKLLMTEPALNYLKDYIVKQFTNNTRDSLNNHLIDIRSIAFGPDNTKFLSGSLGASNNLTLWNISNPYKTSYEQFDSAQEDILSIALSHDGTKLASGSIGIQNNLILSDISDSTAIIRTVLNGHPGYVFSVSFSPDGTKLVSCCEGNQNNLILWNISNPNNITHQALNGHMGTVYSVAFSNDGKKIVSGGEGNQNNLFLWDISDSDNITHQALVGHPNNVYAVAISSDGTKIASGCLGNKNNLIVWNISDPHTIMNQTLSSNQNNIQAIAFNPDGTRMASGCRGDKNNLILWDVSNSDIITQQTLLSPHPIGVLSIAFSPNGKKMISGGYGMENNIIVWTLLTDQQESLLNNLKTYTADQIRLIYQLCLQSSKGQTIALSHNSEEQNVFATLPQEMQDLLTDLLSIKSPGWLSSLWQALTQRKM